MGALRAYLAAHAESCVPVQELCSECGLSTAQLLRAFRQDVGTTPHQFLLSLRVQRAALALRSATPLADAAVDAGFCDQSHFTKTFRKLLGLTPALYARAFAHA